MLLRKYEDDNFEYEEFLELNISEFLYTKFDGDELYDIISRYLIYHHEAVYQYAGYNFYVKYTKDRSRKFVAPKKFDFTGKWKISKIQQEQQCFSIFRNGNNFREGYYI